MLSQFFSGFTTRRLYILMAAFKTSKFSNNYYSFSSLGMHVNVTGLEKNMADLGPRHFIFETFPDQLIK